jgi:hypothetical protein
MPPKATPRMGVPKLKARWQVGQVQSDISQLYRGQGYAATLQNPPFDAGHRANRQLPQFGARWVASMSAESDEPQTIQKDTRPSVEADVTMAVRQR